jgi:two-component system, OmpR family, sensor kinase
VTRPTSLPVLVQVAALAALAVVMSQAVAFAVVVLAPEPRPTGFSIESAANALKGEPAETSDGRALKRRITLHPVSPGRIDQIDPMALAISAGLARRMDVTADKVRVTVDRGDRPRRPEPRSPHAQGSDVRFVLVRPGHGRSDPMIPPAPAGAPEAPAPQRRHRKGA